MNIHCFGYSCFSAKAAIAAFVILTFSLIPQAASAQLPIVDVASFNGDNGNNALGGITLDSSGNLFGTTNAGGALGGGTVYEIAKGSSAITDITSFTSATGADPQSGVVLGSSGNIYGTTTTGGAYGGGTIYEIAKTTDTLTVLGSFGAGTNPLGGLTFDSSGNLYGAAYGSYNNGVYNQGTVYELAKGSGTITTLASFNGANGSGPSGPVTVDGGGNLYGTTVYGGANNKGSIYEVATESGTITTLASFDVHGSNGAFPDGGITMDSSGNLYGTASGGGVTYVGKNGLLTTYGTIFEVVKGSGIISSLASFNGADGASPFAGVVLDGRGNLYGTTEYGGANGNAVGNGDGTVFELAAGSGVITDLACFNGTNGSNPMSGITLDGSGNLYGTTTAGGANGSLVGGYGTVYEITGAAAVPEVSSAFSLGLLLGAGALLGHARRQTLSKVENKGTWN